MRSILVAAVKLVATVACISLGIPGGLIGPTVVIGAAADGILPGMFAIVTATLTTRVVFEKQSVTISILGAQGIDCRHDPVATSLSRTGVGAMMDRRPVSLPRQVEASALPVMEKRAQWALITEGDRVCGVVRGHALESFIADVKAHADKDELLDLSQIHGVHQSFDLVGVHETLAEATERMEGSGVRVVLVTTPDHGATGTVLGVLTRDRIEAGVRVEA